MSSETSAESFVQRPPQQKRSRQSHDRMLKAAEKLMIERGSGDFTLSEISKIGKVSIGSIYCRFSSKEDLIYAVQAEVLSKVNAEISAAVQKSDTESKSLSELVRNLVANFSAVFKQRAPILRAFMHLASLDEIVRETGKKSFSETQNEVVEVFLKRSNEINHKDKRRACESTFRILYAVIARQLGLGMVEGPGNQARWRILRDDLGVMCSMYLTGGK